MTDRVIDDADAVAVTRVRPAAVVAFVMLAFALAWLAVLPLWLGDGLAAPFSFAILPLMMTTPTLALLIVLLVLRPLPRGRRLRFLGVWPLRPARRVIGMSLIGLFGPIVLIALSAFLAIALGWVQADLTGFSGFAGALEATTPDGVPAPPVQLIIALQLISIPVVGATLNALFAFGEELGWRGFLVPALRPLGTWSALLLSGAIWGLWHTPVILLGHNFGRTDITGVLVMTVGCIGWGVLLGWLRLRSASVWPAVFAHGAINAAAGMVMLFHAASSTVDPALAGPLGVAGWIVCAVAIAILALAGQFRRQPQLADPAAPPAANP